MTPSPLVQFSYYFGRVLLESFTRWMLDNPNVTSDYGYAYAAGIREAYRDEAFRNESVIEELELNQSVDPSNLVSSFFYGTQDSHYYKSKNLANKETFLELVKQRYPFSCYDHPTICEIQDLFTFSFPEEGYLGQEDNPSPIDIFEAQWNAGSTEDYYYYPNAYLSMITPGKNPDGIINLNKAKKVVVNKDLEVSEYPYKKTYYIKNATAETNIFVMIDTNSATRPLESIKNKKDNLVIYYNHSLSLYSIEADGQFELDISFGSEHPLEGLYDDEHYYTPSVFTNIFIEEIDNGNIKSSNDVYIVNSTVIDSGNAEYDIGDHWYSYRESKSLGGWAESYNKVWVYSLLNSDNIAENLTQFVGCLNESSYVDCKAEYLKWHHDCPPEDDDLDKCLSAEENAEELIKRIRTWDDHDEDDADKEEVEEKEQMDEEGKTEKEVTERIAKAILFNSYILLGFGCVFCVVAIAGILIVIEVRKGKSSNASIYDNVNSNANSNPNSNSNSELNFFEENSTITFEDPESGTSSNPPSQTYTYT